LASESQREDKRSCYAGKACSYHSSSSYRASLEQHYYEVFNQSNVTLIDLKDYPISEVIPRGIKAVDGTVHELDTIVMTTGFDSLTGGITQIDFKGVDGSSIAEKWENGVYSYLGMTTTNFPNLFFVYGPLLRTGQHVA
jgi:cation diffusion facilitator CzcD-associated flavoprotein CzcO